MKKIDIIILSNTADDNYHNLLSITVNSIKAQTDVETNIILVETNTEYKTKEQYNLPIDVLVVPDEPFHFNKFLNHGLQHSTADYICFSNNDVRYFANSLANLIDALQIYDSASPAAIGYNEFSETQKYDESYDMNKCFLGFCYCFTRKTLNNGFDGKFDEKFSYYSQDGDVRTTLKYKNLKHVCVKSSRIEHMNLNGTCGKGGNSFTLLLNKNTVEQFETLYLKWVNIDKKMLDFNFANKDLFLEKYKNIINNGN